MIIDADTHVVPLEIFDQNCQWYGLDERVKSLARNQFNFDQLWNNIYNQVKDPSWPDCGSVGDFAKLPKHIRIELKHTHNLGNLVHIADELDWIHLDHAESIYPTLSTHLKSSHLFCKVDGQVLNPTAAFLHMKYTTQVDLAVSLMHAWNLTMSKFCNENAGSDFTLWLAVQDYHASLQELEKYSGKNFFGVFLDENVPWAWQKDKLRLFEICHSNFIPVYFHLVTRDSLAPLSWHWDYQHSRFIAQWQKWHGTFKLDRWKINIASLITEGLLDKFSNLRIVVNEHGISWIRHMQHFMLSQGWPDPMPYFQKNFWFTVDVEQENFIEDANYLGWDRLLFATDYPENDHGGRHRFKDVDKIQEWVQNQTITEHQYNLLTNLNYQFLKTRRKS